MPAITTPPDRPGQTVTNPAFPTTLKHVRESVAQVADQFPEYARGLEGWRSVRIVTPVKHRKGVLAFKGGDVSYAQPPPPLHDASHVMVWSARTGSPVPVPARQIVWLG